MNKIERTIWPLIAAVLLLLLGCGGGPDRADATRAEHVSHADHVSQARQAPHAPHAEEAGLPADPAPDHSLYVLPSSWRDQRGGHLALEDLSGEVRVVAMVYTHCTYACPRILAQMKRIEGAVAEAGLQDRVGFTLVSLDPVRDTPERLSEFASSLRLDPERWTLLTGSEGDVRALSVLLGVKYRATADGGVDHSNVITVLDDAGVPTYRLEGLDADTEPAVAAVLSLLE